MVQWLRLCDLNVRSWQSLVREPDFHMPAPKSLHATTKTSCSQQIYILKKKRDVILAAMGLKGPKRIPLPRQRQRPKNTHENTVEKLQGLVPSLTKAAFLTPAGPQSNPYPQQSLVYLCCFQGPSSLLRSTQIEPVQTGQTRDLQLGMRGGPCRSGCGNSTHRTCRGLWFSCACAGFRIIVSSSHHFTEFLPPKIPMLYSVSELLPVLCLQEVNFKFVLLLLRLAVL